MFTLIPRFVLPRPSRLCKYAVYHPKNKTRHLDPPIERCITSVRQLELVFEPLRVIVKEFEKGEEKKKKERKEIKLPVTKFRGGGD